MPPSATPTSSARSILPHGWAAASTAYHRTRPLLALERGVSSACLVLMLMLCDACSITTTRNLDGSSKTAVDLFQPIITPRVVGAGTSVRITGVGFSLIMDNASLGFFRTDLYQAPADCRVVLLPSNELELEKMGEFLREIPLSCSPESSKLRVNE
jgi:hypothetical protein